MQNFDIRLFVLLSGALAGLCFVFLVTIIRSSFPKAIGGVSEWIWACGLAILSAVLHSGYVPLSLNTSRWLGNIALLLSLLMMYVSLRQFARLPAKHTLLSVLVGIVAALLFWNGFIDDDYRVRVMLVMFVNFVLCLACAKTLTDMNNKNIPEYFTLGVFVLLGLISLARLTWVALGIEREHFLEGDNLYQKLYIATHTVLLLVLMFGFMFIVGRRLRETLIDLSAYSDFDGRAREARWQLERDIKVAIARNELVLHYQPRVDVKTGTVVAVEALLRWKHPVKGLIGPNEFIHVAEGSDAILHIGQWVLQQAVDCLTRLHKLQPGLRMSVNASPKQLGHAGFASAIEEALENAEFHPGQLELELTENVIIDDPEKTEITMLALKKIGICLSIDDFGTGYSSLSYLKRLPVDCVKIDRSFIKDLPADQGDAAITNAIIAMGHALGLVVVAEGVETPAQLAFIGNAGCDEYQGYLFSRALPEPELVALLQGKALLCDNHLHGSASTS